MDSEDLNDSSQTANGDLRDIICHFAESVEYKEIIIIFILFIFICSDVFVNRVLVNVPGTVEYKNTTNKGVIVQALFLCLGVIIFHILKNNEVL